MAVGVLFALRLRRRISWAHTWSLLAILTSLVGAVAIANAYLVAAIWNSSATTSQVFVKSAFSELQKLVGVERLVNYGFGQVDYISLATYGLAPIAFLFLAIQLRWPQRRSDGSALSRILLVFVGTAALSIGGIAAISFVAAFRDVPRLGTFLLLYGRYLDAAAPTLLAIALATYAPSIRRAIPVVQVARLRISCALGCILVPAIFLLSFAPDISSGLGFHETVSINHLAVLREPFNFGLAVMVVAVATVGLDVFRRRRLGFGQIGGDGRGVSSSLCNQLPGSPPGAEVPGSGHGCDRRASAFANRAEARLAVDAGALDPHLFYALQYLLPDTTPVLFDSSKHEQPPESLVLSTLAWGPAADRDARAAGSAVWNATGRQSVLWVRKSDPGYALLTATESFRTSDDVPDLTWKVRTGHIRGSLSALRRRPTERRRFPGSWTSCPAPGGDL